MIRLPFKFVKNPKIRKIERKLDLDHFFTFDNGHEIFTYKIEDLTHISGRYLDQIKNTINFMIQYNSSPEQVNTFCNKIGDFALKAIQTVNVGKKDKLLLQISEYASKMPKLSNYVDSLQNKMWLDLYVMFFVLDTEPELAFTPSQNAKKLKYLETCSEEEKDIFFSHLKKLMISFSTTYKEDILNSTIQEGRLIALVESLINPMKTANSLYKQPDITK